MQFYFNMTWKFTPLLNLSNNFGLTRFGIDDPWPRLWGLAESDIIVSHLFGLIMMVI